MAKKKKFYVVWVGKNPGIYTTWEDCKAQIMGFPSAKYKAFGTLEEAKKAKFETFDNYYSHNPTKAKDFSMFKDEIISKSISVDAACSGNPGVMEYQGVDTLTRGVIFYKGPFPKATNNIGEFLALVHGLAYLSLVKDVDTIIYSDSKTAMKWVENRKAKTKLDRTTSNKDLFELIERAENWLKENEFQTKILKWNTERWGEIPADFGRK